MTEATFWFTFGSFLYLLFGVRIIYHIVLTMDGGQGYIDLDDRSEMVTAILFGFLWPALVALMVWDRIRTWWWKWN